MKRKLLIIDDNLIMCQMLQEKAENLGYECELDITGEYFKQKCLAFKPDLMLLDMNLPKISGLGILRELKKDPVFSKIPVIVLSGIREEVVVKEAMDLGAKAYFTKGEDINQLFSFLTSFMV